MKRSFSDYHARVAVRIKKAGTLEALCAQRRFGSVGKAGLTLKVGNGLLELQTYNHGSNRDGKGGKQRG